MSVLPPEVHAELTQLLQALQSPDNNIRSQAEEHLQNSWTNTRPEVLLMGLAEQVQAASDTPVRPLLYPLHNSRIVECFTRPSADNLYLTQPDTLLCSSHFP